jgi:hypothetical protein
MQELQIVIYLIPTQVFNYDLHTQRPTKHDLRN